MSNEPTLDIRTIHPMHRHPLIFEKFEALAPGEGFVLVNDHNPKPLFYQFQAELPGQFTWDYLEQGPEAWRVRIGRPEAAPPEARFRSSELPTSRSWQLGSWRLHRLPQLADEMRQMDAVDGSHVGQGLEGRHGAAHTGHMTAQKYGDHLRPALQ